MRVVILLTCVFGLGVSFARNSARNVTEAANNEDTIKAVVAYGDSYLFDLAEDISQQNLDRIHDSLTGLIAPPANILAEVEFLQSLKHKTEKEVNGLIDSLFSLDSIPYTLINEMNMYISMLPEDYVIPKSFFFIPADTTSYPANILYNSWSPYHPFNYSAELSKEDTSMVLLLTDTVNFCGYFHPVGTKPNLPWYGHMTSPFGWREGKNHNGVDLEIHRWDEVHSIFAGKVRMARNYSAFGNVVIVRHYNGLESLYAHMERIHVKAGQEVEAGTVLGLGGSTGNSTGTHLHLEMRFKGVPLNPSHLISFSDRRLHSDTIILKKTRYSYVTYPYNITHHTVRRGDYVHRIARRYAVSVERICELNNISSSTHLKVGDRIRIHD